MKFYDVDVHLDGDRNAVVRKDSVTAGEIMVLRAIHGNDAVTEITPRPSKGIDRTPQDDIKDRLSSVYRKTRIGPDSDKKLALVAVFPGWPNVDLPTDVKQARIPDVFLTKGFKEDDDSAGGSGDDDEGVTRRTYWKHPHTGEVGVVEKGEVLPEDVEVTTKAVYDEAKKAESSSDEGDTDPDFTE